MLPESVLSYLYIYVRFWCIVCCYRNTDKGRNPFVVTSICRSCSNSTLPLYRWDRWVLCIVILGSIDPFCFEIMPRYGDWCMEWWQNIVCLRHPTFVGIIVVWIVHFWIVGFMSWLGYTARYCFCSFHLTWCVLQYVWPYQVQRKQTTEGVYAYRGFEQCLKPGIVDGWACQVVHVSCPFLGVRCRQLLCTVPYGIANNCDVIFIANLHMRDISLLNDIFGFLSDICVCILFVDATVVLVYEISNRVLVT